MKVECINIFNEVTKQFEYSNYRLTIGKEYTILEIDVSKNKIYYRLIGDNEDQSPALYNASQFRVTSGRIPANWEIDQFPDETLTFGPKSWKRLGFWEDCYDGDPPALEIYKREATLIFNEEN